MLVLLLPAKFCFFYQNLSKIAKQKFNYFRRAVFYQTNVLGRFFYKIFLLSVKGCNVKIIYNYFVFCNSLNFN